MRFPEFAERFKTSESAATREFDVSRSLKTPTYPRQPHRWRYEQSRGVLTELLREHELCVVRIKETYL